VAAITTAAVIIATTDTGTIVITIATIGVMEGITSLGLTVAITARRPFIGSTATVPITTMVMGLALACILASKRGSLLASFVRNSLFPERKLPLPTGGEVNRDEGVGHGEEVTFQNPMLSASILRTSLVESRE